MSQESQLDYVNRDRRDANPLYVPPLFQLFDGPTFEETHDADRLMGQLGKVYQCMKDGKFRTLAEIKAAIECGSEAGISARLRDLRKPRWGGHTVERRRRGEAEKGLHEYRLTLNLVGCLEQK